MRLVLKCVKISADRLFSSSSSRDITSSCSIPVRPLTACCHLLTTVGPSIREIRVAPGARKSSDVSALRYCWSEAEAVGPAVVERLWSRWLVGHNQGGDAQRNPLSLQTSQPHALSASLSRAKALHPTKNSLQKVGRKGALLALFASLTLFLFLFFLLNQSSGSRCLSFLAVCGNQTSYPLTHELFFRSLLPRTSFNQTASSIFFCLLFCDPLPRELEEPPCSLFFSFLFAPRSVNSPVTV